jgi:transposase InsO family protein
VLVSSEERRGAAASGGSTASSSSSGPRSAGGPSPRPSRRSFSAQYKLAIVAEYENAPNGEKGAVLRREGLYSSHVIEWTRARDAGTLQGVTDSRRSEKRPEKRPGRSAEAAELERIRARNAKLEAELTKTRTAWTSWEKHTRSRNRLDIFSRYAVGWLVANTDDAVVAKDFLADAVARNGVIPHTIHADRGGSMTSKPVSELMTDLGVCRSHSRPRCSNDNPYSEAQFKTLKYMPDFPDRFGSLADARAFCEQFFTAYNHEHRHSGIGMHTPASVHYDTAAEVRAHRQATLDRAHAQHPERFTRRPRPPHLPEQAWINQPALQPAQ